jgi:WhiB family redox-sensing transcriptional regulator
MVHDVSGATLLAVPRGVAGSPQMGQNWRHAGVCRQHDPNLFYPLGRGQAALEQIAVAKALCGICPSREPCLAFALASRQELGVWGGTSPDERRRLLGRKRGRPAAS